MPIVVSLGHLGLGGWLASLLLASPPPSEEPEQGRFQLSPTDPRASDHEPRAGRLAYEGVIIPLRVSNHIVRVFGLERPHAYGLDVQLGFDVAFEGKLVGMTVRPETGYAFVHHRAFDSHASITGVGLCLVTYSVVDLCYTPSFVIGSEAGELSRGVRHGLALTLPLTHAVSLEVQHGIAWVGSAAARHELRGALTVDLVFVIWNIVDIAGLARMSD